ncbi:MAG: DNA/RNA non-specific endonuclease [Coriobacteriia bacterium]|nr:DNA/RNA non-specific endonuclease [Coriobacteriia bacterium]
MSKRIVPVKRRRGGSGVFLALILLCLIGMLCGSAVGSVHGRADSGAAGVEQAQTQEGGSKDATDSSVTSGKKPVAEESPAATLNPASVPAYAGLPYVQVLDNVPQFTDADKGRGSFEVYSDLDSLGRCGVAFALIGTETMPTESRGSIGAIEPSGWHTVRYDGLVDNNYLYNRCHLIAYQLAGENDNEKNLITGTRYLNIEGMQPFEDEVAVYVQKTGNHVLLRVTPLYEGDNLVASGVQMEAWSLEDSGTGVSFDVYCYNVQPGIDIDYATGESSLAEGTAIEASAEETAGGVAEEKADEAEGATSTDADERSYVLNTRTKRFHMPGCSSVGTIAEHNREDFTGTRDEVIARGYTPCQKCRP